MPDWEIGRCSGSNASAFQARKRGRWVAVSALNALAETRFWEDAQSLGGVPCQMPDVITTDRLQDQIRCFLESVSQLEARPLDVFVSEAQSMLRQMRRQYRKLASQFTDENIAALKQAVVSLQSVTPITTINCSACSGKQTTKSALSDRPACHRCAGVGRIAIPDELNAAPFLAHIDCPKCNRRTTGRCQECGGSGRDFFYRFCSGCHGTGRKAGHQVCDLCEGLGTVRANKALAYFLAGPLVPLPAAGRTLLASTVGRLASSTLVDQLVLELELASASNDLSILDHGTDIYLLLRDAYRVAQREDPPRHGTLFSQGVAQKIKSAIEMLNRAKEANLDEIRQLREALHQEELARSANLQELQARMDKSEISEWDYD